jgi:hypothetical protein
VLAFVDECRYPQSAGELSAGDGCPRTGRHQQRGVGRLRAWGGVGGVGRGDPRQWCRSDAPQPIRRPGFWVPGTLRAEDESTKKRRKSDQMFKLLKTVEQQGCETMLWIESINSQISNFLTWIAEGYNIIEKKFKELLQM